jgi:hypothetical protein
VEKHAIEHAIYYAGEPGVYHRIKYKFDTNFNLHLSVPECTVKKARLTVEGYDYGSTYSNPETNGQHYYIDGEEVSGCRLTHCANSWEGISCRNKRSGTGCTGYVSLKPYIEAYTSSATKKVVLYSDDYSIWIPETTKSLTLDKLMSIIEPCYPRKMHIEALQPENNFNVIKAIAVPISVNVTDRCGNVIDSASVQVAFENGDTTLLLAHVNDGIYNGTWVPWKYLLKNLWFFEQIMQILN